MQMNATAPQDLTSLEPAEIDRLEAEAQAAVAPARAALAGTRATIRRYVKAGWPESKYQQYLKREAAQVEELRQFEERMLEPFRAEWTRRGGWTRYELCVGGHVHQANDANGCRTRCGSLHPTSSTVIMPNLTNLTPQQVVEEVGHVACTHCFPWAPTTPAWIRSKAEADAENAKKAEGLCDGGYVKNANMRQISPRGTCPKCGQNVSVTRTGLARQHPKERKGKEHEIMAVDGTPLLDDYRMPIKTERTARIELVRSLENALWSERPELQAKYVRQARYLAAAIARKAGEDADALWTQAVAKATKKAGKPVAIALAIIERAEAVTE